jgi:hypothetical protein
MELLGSFFDKYKNLELKGDAAKQGVVRAVAEVTSLNIPIESVVIRGFQIFLKLPAKQKLAVILHREQIMTVLAKRLKKDGYEMR